MSITSVSSSSSLWELYLDKQKSNSAASSENSDSTRKIDPRALIAALEKLQEDPEKLKAAAEELSKQLASAVETAEGKEAEMLQNLAADLATVAQTGDLSVMQEKMPKKPDDTLPNGSEQMSVGGINGAQGASMKWIEALLAEESEEEEISLSSPESLLSSLEKLREKDPEKFQKTVVKLAEEARARAGKTSGGEASMLNQMADDLEDAALTGNLTAMKNNMSVAAIPIENAQNLSGISASSNTSTLWLQAQMLTA